MATVLYVTLEVTLKDGVDPDDIRDEIDYTITHPGVKSSTVVDIELGE